MGGSQGPAQLALSGAHLCAISSAIVCPVQVATVRGQPGSGMNKAANPLDAAVAAVLAGQLNSAEAAARYEVKASTVRSRVSRARARLASQQVQLDPEPVSVGEPEDTATDCNVATPDAATPRSTAARDTAQINQYTPRGAWQTMAAELAGDARLTSHQIVAAAMMVAGHQYSEITAETGISSRTLSRLKHDAVFVAVCSDLTAACHMRARNSLARGAEESVAALRSATALLQRLVQRAHDVLDRFEDPEQTVAVSEVKGALSQAIDAARFLPANAKPLMDAGGFPKTARVEHVSSVGDGLEAKTDEELLAEIAELEDNVVDLARAREASGG